MKKIIALIMALVMVMGLAITASAVNIEITAPDGSGNMSDLTYTAYKVLDASVSEDGTNVSYTITVGDPFYEAVTGSDNFKADVLVPGTTDQYVVQGWGAAAEIIEDLSSVTDKGTGLEATYEDGKFVISDAEEGYYYIESSFGTGIILDTVGKTTVTVEPKNELPTIDKFITEINGQQITATESYTANIGDIITYELSVTIPSTAKPGDAIEVHDAMASGLQAAGTLWGYYGEVGFYGNQHWKGVAADSLNMEADLVGTITVGENNIGKTLILEVSAQLTQNAVIGGNGNVNQAWLETDDYITEKEDATVYTYQVDVYKYRNGSMATPLAGAGFKLKNADGLYYTNTNGIVTWTETGTEYVTATNNAPDVVPGLISFVGLANGTYTLVESTVPAGYNKAADVEVKIENASLTGSSQVDVNNNSGSELPSTGGIGTTLFYVIGGLMMTGAAVLLITKKRMSA